MSEAQMQRDLSEHPALQPRKVEPLLAAILTLVALLNAYSALSGESLWNGNEYGISSRLFFATVTLLLLTLAVSSARSNNKTLELRAKVLSRGKSRPVAVKRSESPADAALRFYADPSTHLVPRDERGLALDLSPLKHDNGDLARLALVGDYFAVGDTAYVRIAGMWQEAVIKELHSTYAVVEISGQDRQVNLGRVKRAIPNEEGA